MERLNGKTPVLLSYDITDDKRRNKLTIQLKNLGLSRIQASVWSAWVDTVRLKEIISISKSIGIEEDKIVVIPICLKCHQKVSHIHGHSLPEKPLPVDVW